MACPQPAVGEYEPDRTCQERFAFLRDGLRPHLTEPARLRVLAAVGLGGRESGRDQRRSGLRKRRGIPRLDTIFVLRLSKCVAFLVALSGNSILAKAYGSKDTNNSCRENEPPPPAGPSNGF